MKTRIFFTFLVLFVSSTTIVYSQTEKCDSLFVKSLQAYDLQNYTKSLAIIYSCIELCESNERYHLHAAKNYEELYNIPKTLAHLKKAIQINDSCVDAYAMKGQIYLDQHFFNRAILNYEKIFSLLPLSSMFNEVYHVNLSKAYNSTQQYQKTYDLLKPLQDQAPRSVGLHANLAVSCIHLNKMDEAEYHLLKCIEIDRYFTGGYINMGFFYITMEQYNDAITYLDKALSINQREAYALNNRGYAYYALGKHERALTDIKESISITPDNSFAYRNLGLVYLATGLTQEACAEFSRALRLGFTSMYGNEVEKLIEQHCTVKRRSIFFWRNKK